MKFNGIPEFVANLLRKMKFNILKSNEKMVS